MNTSKENLLEIKKFNEWKRHHELNEITFRASRPGFAAAAIGRAGARLLGGALGAGRAAVDTIGKTAQVAADANQNVTNVLNRTSPPPRVKGQFIKHSDYASMEGQRVLQTGAAGRSNIKLSAIKALKGAQNAIRAGVRGVKMMNANLSTPPTGTTLFPKDSSQKSTLGKITSAIANGVVDKMVSTIHTYDPGKTTADNRKHNLNAPLGSHILKRLTK
jgi:hypothetical protein